MSTLQNDFASVFQDVLGCCTKTKVILRLQPNAKPVFPPERQVPFAALIVVDLEHLQRDGGLQPVNHSARAASVVAVKKATGKFRICSEFSTGLNVDLDTHQ
ncbi:unnamed protein product [Schistocephalus solidus]|uniref:VPS13_mid_rpt domain-containing protein n=1 Tax=Schistocephalus solidus TaxID=70667 RepID=A0A183S9Q0_SCHSO|nr:unnamed protein product [Schistocephalus solidus]